MTAFPALLGIGAIGSIAGGLLGASGARSAANAERAAANDNRVFTQGQAAEEAMRDLILRYGPTEGLAKFKALYPKDQVDRVLGKAADPGGMSAQDQDRVSQIDSEIASLTGNGRRRSGRNTQDSARIQGLQQERQGIVDRSKGTPEIKGLYTEDQLKAMGPGLGEQFDTLAKEGDAAGRGALAQYDQGTKTLLGRSGAIERDVRRFGQGQEARLRRDAEDARTNLNRTATAALLGSGMGAGSALTDAYAANDKQVNRSLNDSLADLGDRQIGLRTQTAANTVGLLGQRESGRSNMLLGNIDRTLSGKTNALNVRMGGLNSGIYTPFGGRNNSSFFSPASSSAATQQALGSSLAGVGAPLLGAGLSQYLRGPSAGSLLGYGGTRNGVYYPEDFMGPIPGNN